MNAFEELKELFEDDVKELMKKGKIAPQEWSNLSYASKALYHLQLLDQMEQGGEGEYSSRRGRRRSYEGGSSYNSYEGGGSSRRGGGSSYEGSSYEGSSYEGSSYDDEYSGRRGRDARGRYTSRDGGSSYDSMYSGHEEKQQLLEKIEELQKKIKQMQ